MMLHQHYTLMTSLITLLNAQRCSLYQDYVIQKLQVFTGTFYVFNVIYNIIVIIFTLLNQEPFMYLS
jgi:hypothetical protein